MRHSSYYKIIMRSLLFLLTINSTFLLHPMDTEKGTPLMSQNPHASVQSSSVNRALRHPATPLISAIGCKILNDVVQITRYPSMNNCLLQTDLLSLTSLYFILATIALALIYKQGRKK